MKSNFRRNILVTGGCGFIGSHLVKLLVNSYPDYRIINLDKLTYAGNCSNLKDVGEADNYFFIEGDICDYGFVKKIFSDHRLDGVIHLAAESHVDRSIDDPFLFARTNVMGTLSLLEAARTEWRGDMNGKRFHHVSTDEVYGSLPFVGAPFNEGNRYDPHSPYSASKASSDHFVRAYHATYGLPVVITNCSNNYGPYQYPEKLIPLFIRNIVAQKPLPIYGDGTNVRDWLYVEDHVRALDLVFHRGVTGETYNIGGSDERSNIELTRSLVALTDKLLGNPAGLSDKLVTFVPDRAGHDLRYAIDSSKIRTELGWEPQVHFEEGLERTVKWYIDNSSWLKECLERLPI